MTTMRVVGECFFWYRLTQVFPEKFHRAVKRLCVCCVFTVVGSKYYENEKRKDMQIEDRIARQKEELDRLTDQQKAVALAKVTLVLIQLCCAVYRTCTHTVIVLC